MGILDTITAGGPVDIWAASAAAIAGAFLALRSHMLRPDFHTVTNAPLLVWLVLSALSIACWGYVLSIAGGAHALAREALLLTVLAVAAVIMFWNLRRQARSLQHGAAS